MFWRVVKDAASFFFMMKTFHDIHFRFPHIRECNPDPNRELMKTLDLIIREVVKFRQLARFCTTKVWDRRFRGRERTPTSLLGITQPDLRYLVLEGESRGDSQCSRREI